MITAIVLFAAALILGWLAALGRHGVIRQEGDLHHGRR